MAKSLNCLKVVSVLMLLLLLTGCSSLFGTRSSREVIPNEPRTYVAEYGRVWNSALDTLDELGYVIAQMDKTDGYITTELSDSGSDRSKVSLRIVGKGNEVTVNVNLYSTSIYSGSGRFEKLIKDTIAEKLGLAK